MANVFGGWRCVVFVYGAGSRFVVGLYCEGVEDVGWEIVNCERLSQRKQGLVGVNECCAHRREAFEAGLHGDPTWRWRGDYGTGAKWGGYSRLIRKIKVNERNKEMTVWRWRETMEDGRGRSFVREPVKLSHLFFSVVATGNLQLSAPPVSQTGKSDLA